MERTCGGCTACCKILGIRELEKPAGERCKHCSPGIGCKIYEKRPVSCREYKCLWLYGHGEEEDRPDRRKFIFDQTPCPHIPGHTILNIWEVKRGRLEAEAEYVRNLTWIQLGTGKTWVMHHPANGPKLLYAPLGVPALTILMLREQYKRMGIRLYHCAPRAP